MNLRLTLHIGVYYLKYMCNFSCNFGDICYFLHPKVSLFFTHLIQTNTKKKKVECPYFISPNTKSKKKKE